LFQQVADLLYSIVALHGLNGHAIHTWEYNDDGGRFMWLCDSLPEEFPNAQIVTYGYDSNVSNIPTGCIKVFAETFLEHLKWLREGTRVSVQVPPSFKRLIAYW